MTADYLTTTAPLHLLLPLMSTALPNGIYYITSHFSHTVITLTDGTEGTNLTAWERYGGPEQQVSDRLDG
jgi:hypothetical protein